MTGLAEVTATLQAKIFVGYDKELMKFTANAIRLFSLSYLISAINIFTSSFFTALNNGVVSAILSFLRTFAFLVVAILVAPVVLGINGIWLAVVFAEVLSLGVSIFFLLINKKKYHY
ncbi:Multi antimicrobial extrusion protein (Na(+)/drug antiporter), MATE family of MDR efflux pump [Lachnospiraceae bacterium TWA4]|nr:Multi antimicrobial extrusion protein (Na(+)/drug antiporter), MATE family of MDR efflux pump [Lachnospiraceae bacterium TWA4]